MKKLTILDSQKDFAFKIFKDNGLDPSEFQWKEIDSTQTNRLLVSQIIHLPTKFNFIFDYRKGIRYALRTPGTESLTDEVFSRDWKTQKLDFEQWIYCLKREIETPNFWSALFQEEQPSEPTSIPDIPNTPFNDDEREYISRQLSEIKSYLVSVKQLTSNQSDLINKRFDEMEKGLKRFGRRDWMFMTFGMLLQIGTLVYLNKDEVIKLFTLTIEKLQPIIGEITQLLRIQ